MSSLKVFLAGAPLPSMELISTKFLVTGLSARPAIFNQLDMLFAFALFVCGKVTRFIARPKGTCSLYNYSSNMTSIHAWSLNNFKLHNWPKTQSGRTVLLKASRAYMAVLIVAALSFLIGSNSNSCSLFIFRANVPIFLRF